MKTILAAIRKFPVLSLLLVFCLILTVRLFQLSAWIQQDHFTKLASSFLSLRLDLATPLSYKTQGDLAFFADKYYVYFGPLPAILLIPSVAFFGESASQQILGLFLAVFDFWLLYKIARKFTSPSISLWLTIFFIFGTIFLFLIVINLTAYQTQVIAASFLIMSLYEFFHRKRWLLIGLFLAMAGATRPTFYLASIFFLLEILQHLEIKQNFKKIMLLFIPIIITIFITGLYNYLRFGNPLETGYSYLYYLGEDLRQAASQGLFSLKHIPTNMFFLLFKGPDLIRMNDINYASSFPFLKANPWGMGIFFTSPLFLYIFLSKLNSKYVLSSLITSLAMLVPVVAYFGIGVFQYGFRYAVDFYPFLFLILISVFQKNMPAVAKILIIYGILFNFFLMLSIWDVYPF